ncbi:hypothetical protein [Celeribacter halophilus]|uniref:hypothetical protein n=1 Tax=Celeribacter halophilus TaxID=576117 RepID=UPI003A93D361
MTKITRLTLPWIAAFLLFQLSALLLLFGLFDYSRGQDILPQTIALCRENCTQPKTSLARVVLDATLGDRELLGQIIPSENLCLLPEAVLTTTAPSDDLAKFIHAMEFEKIARIELLDESWRVVAGDNTNGFIAAFRKLFSPIRAQKSCIEPIFIWFGPIAMFSVALGAFILMVSLPSRKRSNSEK